MLKVEVIYKGTSKKDKEESLNKALIKFKNKVKDSRLLVELEQRKYFVKKSELNRIKKKFAKHRKNKSKISESYIY